MHNRFLYTSILFPFRGQAIPFVPDNEIETRRGDFFGKTKLQRCRKAWRAWRWKGLGLEGIRRSNYTNFRRGGRERVRIESAKLVFRVRLARLEYRGRERSVIGMTQGGNFRFLGEYPAPGRSSSFWRRPSSGSCVRGHAPNSFWTTQLRLPAVTSFRGLRYPIRYTDATLFALPALWPAATI